MRRAIFGWAGTLVISAVFATPGWSQATLCPSPKPRRDGCSSFVFFNAIGAVGILRGTHPHLNTQTDDDLPSYGGASLGYMHAIDSGTSAGISGEIGYWVAGRFSMKAHVRHWFRNRTSLEAAAGPIAVDIFVPGNGGDERVRAHGATMDVAFIERHGLGFFAGSDIIRGGGRSSTGVHAGLRAESYWALLAGAAVGALYGGLAIGLSHN
jgi:hypothetical protein